MTITKLDVVIKMTEIKRDSIVSDEKNWYADVIKHEALVIIAILVKPITGMETVSDSEMEKDAVSLDLRVKI